MSAEDIVAIIITSGFAVLIAAVGVLFVIWALDDAGWFDRKRGERR